jgi:hypothetical protein
LPVCQALHLHSCFLHVSSRLALRLNSHLTRLLPPLLLLLQLVARCGSVQHGCCCICFHLHPHLLQLLQVTVSHVPQLTAEGMAVLLCCCQLLLQLHHSCLVGMGCG